MHFSSYYSTTVTVRVIAFTSYYSTTVTAVVIALKKLLQFHCYSTSSCTLVVTTVLLL